METRANYVLIGAFVLLAAAALAIFTLWIAGAGSLSQRNVNYDVVFEGAVNGLTEGGEVRFNGIKVGEVQTLKLDPKDPNKVVARIKVTDETPVKTDSVAELNFLGITGVTFIQIRAGSPEAPKLVSTEFGKVMSIPTERTALDELFQGGQDMLTMASDSINRLNDVLSKENAQHVTNILVNVDSITKKLAQKEGAIDSATAALKSIDKAATDLSTAAQTIDQVAKSLGGDGSALVADADGVLKQLGPAVEDVRKAMANINGAVTQINSSLTPSANRALEQLSLAAVDLSTLMGQVQALLGQIEQDPSRFVYRQPQPVE